jgi:glycosyltransferase involved in cell wall biosynthesis
MDPILFVDESCPYPYDPLLFNQMVLGGTEATVIRIVNKLSEQVPITVAQHNRPTSVRVKNVTYSPFLSHYLDDPWQAVVILRKPALAIHSRPMFKRANQMWVWLHDLLDFYLLSYLEDLQQLDVGLIVVSDFHHKQIQDMVALDPFPFQLPKIQRIYNPIEDTLLPDETIVNKNKLFFASSPLKGFSYTIKVFTEIRKKHPHLMLFVSHPSYMQFKKPQVPGLLHLGSLNHTDYLKHLRSAFCVFYPNHHYPETFGLVLAEANAVGTPVLTHPFGAAPEVLSNHDQLVNTHDVEALTERLLSWYNGERPKVAAQEAFRLSTVIQQWKAILLI